MPYNYAEAANIYNGKYSIQNGSVNKEITVTGGTATAQATATCTAAFSGTNDTQITLTGINTLQAGEVWISTNADLTTSTTANVDVGAVGAGQANATLDLPLTGVVKPSTAYYFFFVPADGKSATVALNSSTADTTVAAVGALSAGVTPTLSATVATATTWAANDAVTLTLTGLKDQFGNDLATTATAPTYTVTAEKAGTTDITAEIGAGVSTAVGNMTTAATAGKDTITFTCKTAQTNDVKYTIAGGGMKFTMTVDVSELTVTTGAVNPGISATATVSAS